MFLILGDEGNLVILNQNTFTILPSWTKSLSEERKQDSGILFVILSNLQGEQGRKQRQLMRNLWANNLLKQHRIVFLVTHDVNSEDLMKESELHDDIVKWFNVKA